MPAGIHCMEKGGVQMRHRTFKVEFIRYVKTGQTMFVRTLTVDSLLTLSIVADQVTVIYTNHRARRGDVVFNFSHHSGFAKWAKAKDVPAWILREFAPADEWISPTDNQTSIQL